MSEDTFQIVLENITAIVEAHTKAKGNMRKTYDALAVDYPHLKAIEWHSFRSCASHAVKAFEFFHGDGQVRADNNGQTQSDTQSDTQSEKVRDLQKTLARLEQDKTDINQRLERQIQADNQLAETVRYLQAELDKIQTETSQAQGKIESDIPKTLEGWSINQHKRGYYRAFRKVAGKSRCVHLGKPFDLDAAREKLKAKNGELNLDSN